MKRNVAHLIIDVQKRYFAPRDLSKVFAAHSNPDPQEIEKHKHFDSYRTHVAERIKAFSAQCTQHGIPNIYVMHGIRNNDGPHILESVLGGCATPDRLNAPYIIEPTTNDIILTKTGFDAFGNSELQKTLEEMGITDLIVTGGILDYCIQETCTTAVDKGYTTTIAREMVAPHLFDFNADSLAFRLEDLHEMRGIGNATTKKIATTHGLDITQIPPLNAQDNTLHQQAEPKAVPPKSAKKQSSLSGTL